MNLPAPSPRRALVPGSRARRLALVFMITALLSPVAGLLRAAPHTDRRTPPAYPDPVHVPQGCYLSTAAYLAQFRAEFPAERAAALTVEPRGFYSQHTIAVVSWNGSWWGRDEYFGVFPLNCCAVRISDPNALVRRAEKALVQHSENEISAGRAAFATPPPTRPSRVERLRWVTHAATLLPIASEVFWITSGREEIPVLFFRPAPGEVAVYDPLTGTGRAESRCPNTVHLVKSLATRLGYRADEIRPDFNGLTGPRLASAALMGGTAR
jgi:hypothetical protein